MGMFHSHGKGNGHFHFDREQLRGTQIMRRIADIPTRKAREQLDPIVDQLKAKEFPGLKPEFVRAILGLALRANILDGKPERAEEILAVLVDAKVPAGAR